MTEAAAALRVIRFVGWTFLIGAACGVLVAGAQVLMLSQAAPSGPVDGRAGAASAALAVSCSLVVAVSLAFLRQRRWARLALEAITALAIVVSLICLFVPTRPIEALPPDAPAEYVRMRQLGALADVALPIVTSLACAWILWQLRAPAVRDLFR
jgi:hypothetical protein